MTQPKTLEPKKVKEYLKYEFSQDEIRQFGIDLARLSSEHSELEDEKKSVTSQFKAQMDAKHAEIQAVSNKINSGSERRSVDCEWRYNQPNSGMKQLWRLDTQEILTTTSMTAEEMQLELDLQAPKEQPGSEDAAA